MSIKAIELGCPGHFICARDCNWRRHTQVGNYRISSVGDYCRSSDENKRQTIGAGPDAFFETYVFELTNKLAKGNEGCGCREVKDWSEIDGERYATAGAAQLGHERYVAKYRRLSSKRQRK